MKFGIITDAQGSVDQVDVDLALSSVAQAAGAKHPLAHLDNTVAVSAGLPTARQQVYMQMGLNRRDIKLKDAMESTAMVQAGLTGPTTADNSITGRLVTQAFLFDAIEGSLRSNDYGILGVFNANAAQIDSIAATKFDRPLIDMSRPAQARSRGIAQLAEPARMLTLTVSDVSYKIPATSIGIEYSDQFAASTSLPVVSMAIQRQAEEEALERVESNMLSFLNGDVDIGMAPLSAVPGAVRNAKANFDASLTVAGTLSQKAWVGWLFNGSRFRQINTVITDLAGALAIENRSGRPTVQTDNATSPRIDVGMSIANPTWPDQVTVVITQDPNWPAGTIMGFDNRYGYHIVNSTVLSYEGMEQFASRRATKMRFDQGSIAYRFYDQAWSVLTLSV
jgi:hypothetical protein